MCGPRHRTEQKRPNQWRVVVMRKRMIVFRMIFGRYNLKIPKLDTPCLTTFFEGTTRPTMATRLPDPPGQGRAGIPGNTSLNSHSLDGMGMQFFIAVPKFGMSNGMECFKISFRYWSCDVSKKRRGGWSGIEIPLILGSKEASHSNHTDSNLRTCCVKQKYAILNSHSRSRSPLHLHQRHLARPGIVRFPNPHYKSVGESDLTWLCSRVNSNDIWALPSSFLAENLFHIVSSFTQF